MSLAVYEETEKEIDLAYKELNKTKIEKETSYILSQLIMVMMGTFKDRLKSITFDTHDLYFDEVFITSNKNKTALLNWLKRMIGMYHPIDDHEFGKLKVDLEEWYYQIGGRDIVFEYRDTYLLKPKETAEILGVSTVTLNKYVKRGFEYIPNSSQNRIPKHMIYLWKDPVYAIKVQMLFQEKKLRNQTPEERLKEVIKELLEFQMKYGAEFHKDAFPELDGDEINAIADYYEWEDLEEEYLELKQKVYGERKNGK
ncbi:hypothetical protein ABE28_022120 [Peribacillus muralis]|uniref:Uncharacterized protein n=2 Tax=Peribacillus muralis TaxID=264697 RepID=A0A1B3XV46_9BACI|nr:hypothetical protein ABE28_022120 [Peribacillus muralis]